MKRFLYFILTTAFYTIVPLYIFIQIFDQIDIVQTIILVAIILVASFVTHSTFSSESNGEIKRLSNVLEATQESNKKAYAQIDLLTNQINHYGQTFVNLSPEIIDRKQKEYEEELKERYQDLITSYKLQEDIASIQHAKKIAESDLALQEIKNECERLSREDMSIFYKELISFLIPELEFDINDIFERVDSFVDLRQEIVRRISIVAEYKRNLDNLIDEVERKKITSTTYITLAEAYCNRLIADSYRKEFKQNEILPVSARISAELQTLYLEHLAQKLDWGSNVARSKKVESLRELRRNTRSQLETANYARYQLEYLLSIYPQLQDVLDIEFKDLDPLINQDINAIEHDAVRDYLSKEEYIKLSTAEKNQLALDRYIESHTKTKWQIGRDYELYIGYLCEQKKLQVEYTGSTMRLEDLGRDLIVHSDDKVYIIQCKYWSVDKLIREKHIMQLFGTVIEYKITHPKHQNVVGVLVTSANLSDVAIKFAKELNIKTYTNVFLGNYPRIKCNINKNELGEKTYIYHLPMDLSYDVTKIDAPGEFMAFTVKEAEEAGFRRSYKWHGEQ